jgi:hypothetical protein
MKSYIYIFATLFLNINFCIGQALIEAEGDVQLDNTLEIFDSSSGVSTKVGELIGDYLGSLNTNNGLTLSNFASAGNNFADIHINSTDHIYLSTNTNRHMTISPSGNVGIGTENPLRKLQVLDDIYIGGGSSDYNSSAEHIRISARSDSWYIGALNETTQAASDLIIGLNSSGSGMFHIENGGDVGIGTDNPIAKLHLEDNGHQLVLRNGDDVTNTWYMGASSPSWLVGEHRLVFDDDGNSSAPILCLNGDDEAVSIGTAYVPAGYKLAVNGSIISEEVRVELRGDWPDYVFKPDYDLMPLDAIENSIKEHGHLPGIPSAKEIKENGLHLGDMQKCMMEKLEELTLHIIALKHENNAMRQELNLIKNK